MSRIYMPYIENPGPFDEIATPDNVCWWRQRCVPDLDGNFYTMTIDDVDDPKVVIIEWYDRGLSARITPFKTFLGEKPEGWESLYGEPLNLVCVQAPPMFIDVLWYSRESPTDSPDWYRVTNPGVKHHPGWRYA